MLTGGRKAEGPTGTCLRDNTAVRRQRLASAPAWRRGTRRQPHGLRTVAALPIRRQGVVWGGLTVYDGEPHVFQDQEVALLEEITAAVSLALEDLDQESQRQQAEGPCEPASGGPG